VARGEAFVEATAPFTPLRFGLLSATGIIDDPDPHWQLGTVVQIDPCDSPVAVTGGPCTVNGITKTPTVTGIPSSAAQPFSVYAWVECATIGTPPEEIVQRTERLLTNGENRAVEHIVWTGAGVNGTVFPHLAANAEVLADQNVGYTGPEYLLQSPAEVVTTGAPVSLTEGIGLLEGALAECYGGEGVIHVPAGAVIHLSNVGILKQQGQQLRTLLGTVVAAYASGDREGPDGVDPPAGESWIYATSAITGRRSPIKRLGTKPAEFVDRGKNGYVYVVERTYVIDWGCCHFAAQVRIPGLST
jgi:hypothetical protein